ncbi:probable methyltransferase-like protein 24 isoform X2 [Scylla paramamosain]|uniref:probable methyltransferase-like protein 24 isoform X2 n=1 Tax=Scylla paramamosain TaxID=85552 RepID=UPI003083D7E7
MVMRYPTVHITLLTTLILVTLFTICRYYQEQQLQSLLTRTCHSTSSSSIAGNTSRDGAFFRAGDIAERNEDWGEKVCSLQQLSDLNDFYEYIYTSRVPCDFKMMLGGRLYHKTSKIDGDKWVCMDKQFNISPKKCLVFSFGIGADWSFEDETEGKLGCKVFAFDPTINKETHNRTEKISFFNLGIGDSNKTGPTFKVKTNRYCNILSGLGHLNSVIDILKIDIEGSELRVFRDVLEGTPNLLKNVKFIAMEVHIGGKTTEIGRGHKAFWKYFQLLDCFGFKILYSAINPFSGGRVVNGRRRSCCYEIVWVQDRSW